MSFGSLIQGQTITPVPGIPTAALDAIQDENVRYVLQALIDGWHVRNGAQGDGSGAFVTRADITRMTGDSPSAGNQGNWRNPFSTTTIVASSSTSEGSGGVSQTQLDAVSQRVTSVEGAINGIATTVSNIWTDPNYTGLSASVQSLGQADVAIGQRITDSVSALNTSISDVRSTADTTATGLSNLSQTVTTIAATVSGNTSAIQTEAQTRADAYNALSQSVSTQFASVNGAIAGIKITADTAATDVSALTSTVNTLSTTVSGTKLTGSTFLPATTALVRMGPPSFLAAYTFFFRQGERLDEAVVPRAGGRGDEFGHGDPFVVAPVHAGEVQIRCPRFQEARVPPDHRRHRRTVGEHAEHAREAALVELQVLVGPAAEGPAEVDLVAVGHVRWNRNSSPL